MIVLIEHFSKIGKGFAGKPNTILQQQIFNWMGGAYTR